MALIVQKYGGTSVKNINRIREVASRVISQYEKGHDLVVVVSAMAGETDRLMELAGAISDHPNERELDVLLTTGEQVSTALLALTLTEMGYTAKSFQGHQVKILTDSAFLKARILSIDPELCIRCLDERIIAVVAGFQGIDENDNLTTLGRGGSDTTAVALAAALKADVCEIYTDVDGVYTTDPNIVPTARKLDKITYDEMLEMASLGAKVLHIRSVAFAKKYNVPLHVRSSYDQSEGTWVVKEEIDMEDVSVTGVTYNRDEAKITILGIPDEPATSHAFFAPFDEAEITIDMIVKTTSTEGFADFSFTVSKNDFVQALALSQKVADRLGAVGVESDRYVAKVSVIGLGMHNHTGIAAKLFETYAKEGIHTQMVSTSEIKMSTLINEKYTELAVRSLHAAFGLDQEKTGEESTS